MMSIKMNKLLLFNKPFGVVCQFSGDGREPTLANFISVPNVYAAGRLDKNSEGLLLLTSDGRLQHQLTDPKYNKKKYYWVQVDGRPHDNDLIPLRQGLQVGTNRFLPASVHAINEPIVWPRNPPIRVRQSIPTSWLNIILSEGKNHQIRHMTAAIGFPTVRLIRYRIANWSLTNLLPGQWRAIDLVGSR
jgi:23S rRNA pseudouridine2457 synthase